MNKKPKIVGKYQDGWLVEVPVEVTCKFLEYSRGKDIAFDVSVGAISGGGVPDTDIFCFSEYATKEQMEKLLGGFAA